MRILSVVFLAVVIALATLGVGWWAVCYASAKFVAELFLICIPLIASKAHAEEAEAMAQSSRSRSGDEHR